MKTKVLLSLFLLFAFTGLSQQYSKVKIYTNDTGLEQLDQMGIAVDHGSYKRGSYFISDFSDYEMQKIQQAGFSYDILIPDVKKYYAERSQQMLDKAANSCPTSDALVDSMKYPVPTHFNLGSMGGYYTYEEFLQEIHEMDSIYPNLITLKDTISSFVSHEGRPIYWMRISDNPNSLEAEPELLYTAVHHAREPESLTQLIYFMWYILENYGTNEEVTAIIDNTQLYFVPMINPDGYRYNQTTDPNGGGMWRKNRRNNGDGTYGVDNNRNYSHGWNTTGTTQTTSDETYCGPAAFSEPENQAMRYLAENHNFRFAFNYHTYGNLLLFPIGTTIADTAPHNAYLSMINHHMASQNGYTAEKSSGLYPASGDSDDYLYMEDIGVGLKDTVFSMTPEISSDADGFWPAVSRIIPIAQENVFPNLVLSHLTHRYAALLNLDASTIDTINGNFNASVQRMGLENGSITVSVTPLQNIQTVAPPMVLNLALKELDSLQFAYTLASGIQFGDTVKYILLTDFGIWKRRDTIVRVFKNNVAVQLADNANTTSNWQGDWNTTTESYYSPNQSFTDSPNQNYDDNVTTIYNLIPQLHLTGASSVMARFYTRFNIETDYDYVAFEASTDGGSTWQQLCGKYTNPGVPQQNWLGQDVGIQPVGEPIYDGVQTSWVLEEVDLSDLIGQTVQLRFKLQSDGGTNEEGFYFDDFQLFYNGGSLGISEQNTTKIDLSLYPNPANQSVALRFTSPTSGTIFITETTGKIVKSIPVNNVSNEIDISTSDLTEGIYFVRWLDNQHKVICKKLVVAR